VDEGFILALNSTDSLSTIITVSDIGLRISIDICGVASLYNKVSEQAVRNIKTNSSKMGIKDNVENPKM